MDWLQNFDLIKTVDDAIQMAVHGRGVKITWAATSTQNGVDGEALLRAYGVQCWARQYTDGKDTDYGIRVGPKQSAYADALLRVSGFAVTSPHLGKSFKVLPAAWKKPVKPVGFAGFVGAAFGFTNPKYNALAEQRKRQTERRNRRGR